MSNLGIDVSEWQGMFNFDEAKKEGITFAILRSSYGMVKDKQFERNYSECKRLGIPVGVYLYAMDNSETSAISTANWLLSNCLTGKQFEYPIYYDMEDTVIKNVGKIKATAIAKAFLSTLESKGYFVGIYASENFYSDFLNDNELTKYTHWVASWKTVRPSLPSGASVPVWQFGGETNMIRSNKIAGEVVDQDFSYFDFSSTIKGKGLNGYNINEPPSDITKGCKVTVLKNVTYTNVPFKVYFKTYDVIEVKGDRVVIGQGNTVTCAININNIRRI